MADKDVNQVAHELVRRATGREPKPRPEAERERVVFVVEPRKPKQES